MLFAVPANQRMKIKENEKRDEYLHPPREHKSFGAEKWGRYQL